MLSYLCVFFVWIVFAALIEYDCMLDRLDDFLTSVTTYVLTLLDLLHFRKCPYKGVCDYNNYFYQLLIFIWIIFIVRISAQIAKIVKLLMQCIGRLITIIDC